MENLSNRMAVSIHKNSTGNTSIAVLKFSISTLLNLIIMISIVLAICAITGDIINGIVACVMFPLLRYFSGGLHLKSANLCNIISALFILISIYTPIGYWYNGFIANLAAILILLIFAPSGIKKSKLPAKYYPALKIISVIIVATNLVLHSPLLSMVFLMQSLTTIPIFTKLLDYRKM